jgi:glucose/arabinose dehydrogenase
MAFTPDGELLITELAEAPSAPATGNQALQGRQGQVRIVRRGVLAPMPLVGWPTPGIDAGALQSAIVHPQFASNRFVYLYYIKKRGEESGRALARARLEGDALIDVREIFESDSWIPGGPMAGRAAFGPDGMIYLTVNDHVEHDGRDGGNAPKLAQQLDNDVGKVLRIRDDGGIPSDNPFVGRERANGQVFTYGQSLT